ncbi:cytochrome P450 [Trametes elegans]|nr:cytochrome P450 [Trametes elegans]
MEGTAPLWYSLAAVSVVFVVLRWRAHPLRAIPTVGGPSLPLLSYLGVKNFILHGEDVLHEGYHKHYGSAFKVALLDQWLVVVAGPEMVADVRTRPDSELSHTEGASEFTHLRLTLNRAIDDDPYHIPLVRETLTGSLSTVLPDVVDEIQVATQERIPVFDDGRNQKYLDLGINFVKALIKDQIINDMLQWIMNEALPRGSSNAEIVERILILNLAAIHTSSIIATHALYHLAAHTEYAQALREEIAPIVEAEGWTRDALGKMWKLDSLLRETLRYDGVNTVSIMRKAMMDVTLADGTFLPRGTLLVADAYHMHHDPALSADTDADAFDPFRFARMRTTNEAGARLQAVSTSVQYIPFSHGRHACPGRFFAAEMLKLILAHIVLKYDVKFGENGGRPANVYWAQAVLPAPDARILFRKRG